MTAFKVSLNSAAGKGNTTHNDRTLYRGGYVNEFAIPDPFPNYHHTMETLGKTSTAAERDFYEDELMPEIVEWNDRRRRKDDDGVMRLSVLNLRNPKERAQAIKEFSNRYPPRETIYQVGNMEIQPSQEVCNEIFHEQIAELEEKARTMKGFHLISADIHNDEATPHMHVRYFMLGDDGLPNAEACLARNDVEPPVPYDRYFEEEKERRLKRAEKNNGEGYKEPRRGANIKNNRMITFTAQERDAFERLCEEHGLEIDKERVPTKAVDIHTYKRQRLAEVDKTVHAQVTEYERRATKGAQDEIKRLQRTVEESKLRNQRLQHDLELERQLQERVARRLETEREQLEAEKHQQFQKAILIQEMRDDLQRLIQDNDGPYRQLDREVTGIMRGRRPLFKPQAFYDPSGRELTADRMTLLKRRFTEAAQEHPPVTQQEISGLFAQIDSRLGLHREGVKNLKKTTTLEEHTRSGQADTEDVLSKINRLLPKPKDGSRDKGQGGLGY